MEKPDWVSWEDIHQCLYKAHSVNRKRGFNMLSQNFSAEKIRSYIEGRGNCFVALEGEKLIGVATVRFFKCRRWWAWNKTIAYPGFDGIIPEYQGTDVFLNLDLMRRDVIKKSGVRIIQSNTAENNDAVLRRIIKAGWKFVQYSPTDKGANHYSVIYVKWIDGCPWPDWFVSFMYNISKLCVRAIWKPGKQFRWKK